MKTEIEIKALPLEELQKFVLDLRRTPAGDKNYVRDRDLVSFATNLKKWKEPEGIEVQNVAEHDVMVDGVKVPKGATAKVFPWQLNALSRFLEPVSKTAALILFAFLLAFGFTASAQVQTTAVGAPGGYHAYYIAGLSGGTNNNPGTNFLLTPVITSITNITPNWILSNGVAYNLPMTNITSTTNIPGLISVINSDLLNIFWGFQYEASGVMVSTLTADWSNDAIYWQTNAGNWSVAGNGLNFVSTNIQLSQFAPGYIRFNTMACSTANLSTGAVTNAMTNLVLSVSGGKPKPGPF